MLVSRYIYEAYNGFMGKATDEQKAALVAECDELMLWGERRAQDVIIPERETVEIKRVYELDAGPEEVPIERVVWPLEKANKGMLLELDKRIVQAYRTMKGIGFERPSIVLSCAYYYHSHTVDRGDKFEKIPMAWAGVMIVCQRLEGACRLAVRFAFPERFGPKITENKDGSTLVEYTKEAWRLALVRRGIVSRKKMGGEGASRKGEHIRDEMRQVSGSAKGAKGRRAGGSGRGGKEDDVNGAVRGAKQRGFVGGVQGDLPSLPFPPEDTRQEDGSSRPNKRWKRRA